MVSLLNLFQAHPEYEKYRNATFPLYEDLDEILNGALATGKGAFHAGGKKKRRSDSESDSEGSGSDSDSEEDEIELREVGETPLRSAPDSVRHSFK